MSRNSPAETGQRPANIDATFAWCKYPGLENQLEQVRKYFGIPFQGIERQTKGCERLEPYREPPMEFFRDLLEGRSGQYVATLDSLK